MEATIDVLGPVDWIVVEFPADKAGFSGEMATELRGLVDRRLVRVLDVISSAWTRMGRSTSTSWLTWTRRFRRAAVAPGRSRAPARRGGHPRDRGGARAGSIAAILGYENSWAATIAASVRRAGGQLVSNGRISTQALLAAIESEESAGQGRLKIRAGLRPRGSTSRVDRPGAHHRRRHDAPAGFVAH